VYLLGGCALALLVQLLVLRNPAPLLHPILLGRQGESARVRKPKESAVWHHASAASSSMLVARPLAAIKGLRDVVDALEATDKLRVQSIAAQLRTHFGSYQDGSEVVLLLDETEGGYFRLLWLRFMREHRRRRADRCLFVSAAYCSPPRARRGSFVRRLKRRQRYCRLCGTS
jgi:hypothetical protein